MQFFMPFMPLLYRCPTIFDRAVASSKEELGILVSCSWMRMTPVPLGTFRNCLFFNAKNTQLVNFRNPNPPYLGIILKKNTCVFLASAANRHILRF